MVLIGAWVVVGASMMMKILLLTLPVVIVEIIVAQMYFSWCSQHFPYIISFTLWSISGARDGLTCPG